MIDFSNSDRQLIDAFGQEVEIDGVKLIAIFNERSYQFGDADLVEYSLLMIQSDFDQFKTPRGLAVSVNGRSFIVRSHKPQNGVVNVILN